MGARTWCRARGSEYGPSLIRKPCHIEGGPAPRLPESFPNNHKVFATEYRWAEFPVSFGCSFSSRGWCHSHVSAFCMPSLSEPTGDRPSGGSHQELGPGRWRREVLASAYHLGLETESK